MADRLVMQFHLLVARVQVRVAERKTTLNFRLYQHSGTDRQTMGEWDLPLSDEQIDGLSHDAIRDFLRNPNGVAAANIPMIGEPGPGKPIWLHLVKPYGHLGAFAWEGELELLFKRPVLRLPDFADRPPANTQSLDVAVCCDVVGDTCIDQLTGIVRGVIEGSPRRLTQVYVFVNGTVVGAMKRNFANDSRVWVAPAPGVLPTDIVPWVDNMIRVLDGRSVDIVHFVSRADTNIGGVSLAMTDPAGRPGTPSSLKFCSPRTIAACLTRLGAWAAGFSPAPGARERELREFGDAVAQARPGAVVFSPHPSDVSSAYRFLFSPTPVLPSPLGTGFLYCHPSRVPDAVTGDLNTGSVTHRNADLFADSTTFAPAHGVLSPTGLYNRLSSAAGWAPPVQSSANTPSWIAATQRYVESCSLNLQRQQSKDALLAGGIVPEPSELESMAPSIDQNEISKTVNRTLADIQGIVASFAKKTSGGSNA